MEKKIEKTRPSVFGYWDEPPNSANAKYLALWQNRNLAETIALHLVDKMITHKNERAKILEHYDNAKRELGANDDNPLLNNLIEHTALCWLRLQDIEDKYTDAINAQNPIKILEYWERCLSNAQKRYLKAMETLGRMKRLRLPVIQVNIADKQINVAGD